MVLVTIVTRISLLKGNANDMLFQRAIGCFNERKPKVNLCIFIHITFFLFCKFLLRLKRISYESRLQNQGYIMPWISKTSVIMAVVFRQLFF